MIRTSIQAIFFGIVVGVMSSCNIPEKELLPGEEQFIAQVQEAEQKMVDGSCDGLAQHYAEGILAFKEMMPHLKGLALTRRDMQLEAIREFIEQEC